MNELPFDELRPPPPPDAAPGGRGFAHASPPPRNLVRVTGPDLKRKAQMDKTRGRLVVAACGFGLLFSAVALKLTMATVLNPVEARLQRGGPARIATPDAPATRASVTDRNGEILAVSLPVTALYARPREVEDAAVMAERLSRVLPQLDRERLQQRLSSDRQFTYIARALTPREQAAVNALGMAGLYFEGAERRFYPQGRAAVHVLGQVDVDGNGIAGVERFFDERLRSNHEPLRLSVDVRVQLALRDAVQRAIADFNGIGGAGVVMDVNTAEVVAMVSLPDYDASDPATAERRVQPGANPRDMQGTDPRFNRVTVGVYEPGSTFKLLTAAMALDLGTTNIWGGYDASRPISIGRFTINDFKGKHRFLQLPEILAYSSNIASAHMAQAVGPARHREFMGRMGMLSRLQVELPESAHPLAPSARNWREINTLTIGFGHGIAVTPLHVVTGVTALVNGGTLRHPTLVAQPAGQQRDGVRVISERTSDTLRRLMRLVVTDGSGRGADVPGYFVGGKTGTAQKTDARGHYMENRRIAAFVGAFPMQAPRYALYVMVDEPKPNANSHGYATAGWVAAPAAGMVISRVAPILGLVPETERLPQIQQTIAIPLQPSRPPRAAATPAAGGTTPRRGMEVPPARTPEPPLRRTEAVPPGLTVPPIRLVSAAQAAPEAGHAAR